MNDKILLTSQNATFLPLSLFPEHGHHYGLFSKCTYVGPCETNFHEHLEMVYFLSGKAKTLQDDRVYPLTPGCLVISNPYVIHQLILEEKFCGYFALSIGSAFFKNLGVDILTVRFDEFIQDPHVTALFHKLIEQDRSDIPFKSASIKLVISEILVYLLQNYSHAHQTPSILNNPAWKYIHTATQYIKEHIDQKIIAKEVAAAVGLSEYHFMREFKKIMGHTLSNYINILRCEHAKYLMVYGKHQIKEIALLCGFEVESYFAKVFRKYTGMLPSEYVQSMQPIDET